MTHSYTILVLEDERPLATVIKDKLEKSGFEVVTARSVKQSLEYVSEIPQIDLIWLDHYLLGEEDGLDFVVELKKSESPWKHVPIFVVSNTASEDKVHSYLHLGATKYYAKTEHRLDTIVDNLRVFLENKE